jgi:hypothetical protein
MLGTFFQDIFLSLSGAREAGARTSGTPRRCETVLADVVEHVVDETDVRLRALPGYARRLRDPVATAIRHVDAMVEGFPDARLCSRSAFGMDPSVNAFFVDANHLREVFSQSLEVRQLFEENPSAQDCWALLCMRKEERQHLGMGLNGDAVQREVMQTAVSFTDHQVISPGATEVDARCALKCCVLKAFLGHIRQQVGGATTTVADLETRLRVLRGRLKEANRRADAVEDRSRLERNIGQAEQDLAGVGLRLATLDDQLAFVAESLAKPEQFLTGGITRLRVSRLGIKLEGASTEAGNEIELSEIHIASHGPRVGSLVRFPREELLPQPDFFRNADLFLAL